MNWIEWIESNRLVKLNEQGAIDKLYTLGELDELGELDGMDESV